MSSLAARRAGNDGGTDAGEGGDDDDEHELAGRDRELGEALVAAARATTAQPKNSPIARPSSVPSSAMITDSHRTAERTWRAAHADRAQQPDLAGALVDRQRERVGDADQRDDDREEQQRVDEVRRACRSALPASFLYSALSRSLAVGYGFDDRLDRGPTVARHVTPGLSLAKHE